MHIKIGGQKLKYKICDIHSHIVYAVDDGASSLNMSIEMLRMAARQGVSNIVCTSHSGCDTKKYLANLENLKKQVREEKIDINLYSGCEIYCSSYNIEDVISGLCNNKIPTINETKYILVEFSSYISPDEMMFCIKQLHERGYKTIIAHVERYYNLQNNMQYIQELSNMGCIFQINAYSLENERKSEIKDFARKLLIEKYVSFIGSDAHRTDHRTYAIKNGVDYIAKYCDEEYAKDVCYRNAERLLNI